MILNLTHSTIGVQQSIEKIVEDAKRDTDPLRRVAFTLAEITDLLAQISGNDPKEFHAKVREIFIF